MVSVSEQRSTAGEFREYMSSLDFFFLREVVLTSVLTILGVKFCLISITQLQTLTHVLNVLSCEKSISKQMQYFQLRNFRLQYTFQELMQECHLETENMYRVSI